MKLLGSFIFMILVATALVVSVAAQTSLSLWPYYVEITPQKNSIGIHDVIVPLEVMDKARADLADLRLFDSANREIPYAIRLRRDDEALFTWKVPVPSYQLLRNQGAPASAWTIDLGGRAPCDRLKLQIEEQSFSRPFQVEVIDDPQNVRLIATGDLTRRVRDDLQKPLEITFDEEQHVRKLRLQVTDYSNPTLNITSIEAGAPARQLLFELKEPPSPPLRLYFGNRNVTAPHYDFEKELPVRLSGEAIHGAIGRVTRNSEYIPEPLPLTERVPWLIYLVLAASSIALALILLSLARTAMRGGSQRVSKETKEGS